MYIQAEECAFSVTTIAAEAAPGVEYRDLVLIQSHRKGDIERLFGVNAVRVIEKTGRSHAYYTVVPKTRMMAVLATLLLQQGLGDLLDNAEETGGRLRAYEEINEILRRHGAGLCEPVLLQREERDANTIDMFDIA